MKIKDQNVQNIEKPTESVIAEVKEHALKKHKKVDK